MIHFARTICDIFELKIIYNWKLSANKSVHTGTQLASLAKSSKLACKYDKIGFIKTQILVKSHLKLSEVS